MKPTTEVIKMIAIRYGNALYAVEKVKELENFLFSEFEHVLRDTFIEQTDEDLPEVDLLGCSYGQASALQEVDPIAFRCAYNDWLDYTVNEAIDELAADGMASIGEIHMEQDEEDEED